MKTENIFSPSSETLDVAVLVLDDCNTLSLAAAVDPLRAANRRAGRRLFAWQFFTPASGPSNLTSGLSIDGPSISRLTECDFLIVVAGFRLREQTTPALCASLRRLAPRCTAIAAIDGGPWVLASAGLLDGQSATTHWEDLPKFAAEFDAVDTVRNRYVISGKYLTSGGASPAIDMMLHLIRARHGDALARDVSSAFLYDASTPDDHPQGPAPHSRLARRHPSVSRAVSLMESQLETPLKIPEIARELGISPRLLEIRFQNALGTSPNQHYLSIRLSEAHRLAIDSTLPVQEIALSTGFASQAAFARAFRNRFNLSVRTLRASLS